MMKTKHIMDTLQSFFTVRNSLIVVICILSLILIVQNLHIFGGSKRSGNFNGNRSNSSSQMRLPGMMGGGMGGARRLAD